MTQMVSAERAADLRNRCLSLADALPNRAQVRRANGSQSCQLMAPF